MIHLGSTKSLWSKHKEDFIKFYLSEQNRPVQWGDLETLPYTDSKGLRYARFGKDSAMPVERFARLMEFYQYLAKGLSPEEDSQIDDAIEATLMEGVSFIQENGIKTVNQNGWYARVMSLIHERRKRKEFTGHVQLFYNILAVQIVREDESPTEYNNEIQMQKVMEFGNNATPERIMFFFQLPELKRLTDLSRMSSEDVQNLLTRFDQEQKELREKIKTIMSFRPSKSTLKTGAMTGKKAS